MKIFTDNPEGVTVVRNSFIDRFMPYASGEFVKVYLYLLRCANTGREFSISSIADIFDHTEKDVQRAISYWDKQKLIRVIKNKEGELISLTFTDPDAPVMDSEPDADALSLDSEPAGPALKTPLQDSDTADTASAVSDPAQLSRDQISDTRQQEEMKQLIYVAEQYIGRPLDAAMSRELVYCYDDLHFSADLIEYLVEYCISKGSVSHHYLHKVALGWSESGITTVAQAKKETRLFNKNFYRILNAFGIKGRGPAEAEQEAMNRWFDEYGFDLDIILEACRRTILQTHQPSFPYADSILRQWKAAGIHHLADIEQQDEEHKREKEKTPSPAPKTAKTNGFNNFTSRSYNYNSLEKQLLDS